MDVNVSRKLMPGLPNPENIASNRSSETGSFTLFPQFCRYTQKFPCFCQPEFRAAGLMAGNFFVFQKILYKKRKRQSLFLLTCHTKMNQAEALAAFRALARREILRAAFFQWITPLEAALSSEEVAVASS